MVRISLTTWFAVDELDTVLSAHGVVGHLTEEQYSTAKEWIKTMAQWTDENRKLSNEVEDDDTGRN